MTTIRNALVGTVAAGALAMVPATAASAQGRYDRGGISAGEIIAGVAILGGIAAVASSIGSNNRNDDRYYRNGNYGYYNGNPRAAVEQCVQAARIDAQRRGYGYAQVTDIRDVDDTRYGWRVKGRLAVDGARGGYYTNSRYDRYDNRRGRYDSRYDSRYARDDGSFTCYVDRGRVSRVDYSGIRGL